MGFIIIRLIEARSLESKESGAFDPFVTFKIVSNETQETVARTKSKVVKKSLSPQFHETLNLTLPSDNLKGYSLKVVVGDWNMLKKTQKLGDYSVQLEDLKPLEEKEFKVSLHNSSSNGSIHFLLTLHPDRRNNILVSYESDGPVEYSLMRGVKLTTQMDLLCQLFQVLGTYDSYILVNESTDSPVTQENLTDPSYEIPPNTRFQTQLCV